MATRRDSERHLDVALRRLAIALACLTLAGTGAPALTAQSPDPATALTLTATAHPPLPSAPEQIWIAPAHSSRALGTPLARGVAELSADRADAAVPLLAQAAADPQLSGYQRYYHALALTRAGRTNEAAAAWAALDPAKLDGALADAIRLKAGSLAEAASDFATARAHYEALGKGSTAPPDDVLLRLGRTRLATNDRDGAIKAFLRLHEDFPLSTLAPEAAAQLTTLGAWPDLKTDESFFKRELARAERLFAARRYAQARDAFERLQPAATSDHEELVALRLAESDHYLKRHAAARTALAPWVDKARRRAEARFFYLTATRELGERAEYVRLADALVAEFPEETWAEETLNNLATHYVLVDEDRLAEETFKKLLSAFPTGRHAPRAAWRAGWFAYRQGRHAEAAELFEQAAQTFPRSDYRPSWIYWAARSRDQLGDARIANRLYGILVADYMNSYYGRVASRTLTSRKVEPMAMAATVAPPAGARAEVRQAAAVRELPGNEPIIRALIVHGLYDDAIAEVEWAQKQGGDTPALQATLGLIHSRKGDLRRGINAVKRAYPQYLAAGGESLPPDVLEVLFPVAYWSLIEKHAVPKGLDPYLIAALMAQESTFDAKIRSHANAIGLMQVVPATGRRYARMLKIPRFSAAKLTDPEINVRIGTAYFADLVERFGGAHHALASYNAGPGAVARWIGEKPGIARDEFIDDIPYPETQNYVKRILGTADDYRRLYDGGGGRLVHGPPGTGVASPAKVVPAKATPKKPAAKTPAKKVSRRADQN
jgi:soluble lytic murein transglycosylase